MNKPKIERDPRIRDISFSGGSVYVDYFYTQFDDVRARLTFMETQPNGSIHFRTSVVMDRANLEYLRDLLNELIPARGYLKSLLNELTPSQGQGAKAIDSAEAERPRLESLLEAMINGETVSYHQQIYEVTSAKVDTDDDGHEAISFKLRRAKSKELLHPETRHTPLFNKRELSALQSAVQHQIDGMHQRLSALSDEEYQNKIIAEGGDPDRERMELEDKVEDHMHILAMISGELIDGQGVPD